MSQKEVENFKKLNLKVKTKIENNQEINDLEIICLSCYAPLYKFDWCEKIKITDNLSEIFIILLKNYKYEKKASQKIKSLSKINNKISLAVKNQYEENPYPSELIWV